MRVYRDFDLTHYNSYRLKSICRTAYFPESEDDVVALYKSNKSIILLGSGHNLILSKNYYDEDFLIFNGNFNEVRVESKTIRAEAGATILEVSETAEKFGLTGAEFFYDIPSSVGGAVVMNAGTKEGETKNILKKVRYLDLKDMQIKEKVNKELDLGYRISMFQKQNDKIILQAWFQLLFGDCQTIRKVMDESKKRRWSKQPREYPNSGSVFKRPKGHYVGPMIEKLGMKGYRVGGAQVSEKHAGFIVNAGDATGEEILKLITMIQDRVRAEFGVELVVEQKII